MCIRNTKNQKYKKNKISFLNKTEITDLYTHGSLLQQILIDFNVKKCSLLYSVNDERVISLRNIRIFLQFSIVTPLCRKQLLLVNGIERRVTIFSNM